MKLAETVGVSRRFARSARVDADIGKAQAFDLPNGDRLVSQIGVAALSKDADGLVIIIDELGKYLEHAALDGGDAHILQDLAELSARSQSRLLIVGILHQSFERYAAKL